MNRNRLGTSGGLSTYPANGSTSDDDDLYSGYNEFPSALNTEDLEFDESFQNSARTLESRRPTALPSRGGMPPGTGYGSRLGTAAGFQRQSTARTGIFTRSGTARPITGIGGESGGLNRPMTAVRGAGYTGSAKTQQGFDPLNSAGGNKSATPSIEPKVEDTVEEKMKQLEEKINDLVEQSVLAGCKADTKKALDLAKEAANKERSLIRLKEQAGANEGHDWDITFSVMFNLASQYEACEMFSEALTTYHDIAKNKVLAHGAKVKINMGNIYYKQNNPAKAIKMYRMAMDQLNNTNRDLRLKLMHNMGILFLKMNQATDAAASFEYIMQERPSFKTGLHLVVANFMTGDPDKMKRAFQDLLDVPMDFEDEEEKYASLSDDPVSQLLVEVLKNDKLRKLEKERKLYAERCILSAARLVAPAVESTFSEGYHWVTEAIRSSTKHAPLAHALEISKALVCLKQRELSDAIEILKSFEKKETKVATAAATNLSFMFYLQGDLEAAEKYGMMASKADFYNSNAYVNLGNCHYAKGDYEEARRSYAEAVQIDASCAEALFNLGLVNQTLKFYEDALTCFHKVQSLVKNHPHVTFQLGRTHELMGETEIATEWFLKALALNPSDSGILKKLGELADMEGDRQQAYQHYYDCYKYDPSDLDVIHWLASYLQEMGLPDKALSFYQKALSLQPNESRWQMLMGAAYRRVGNYSLAIECFQKVYRDNPENLQALQNLVKLTSDLGMPESETYREDLMKLERTIGSRLQSARMRSGQQDSGGRFAPPSRMGSSGQQLGSGISGRSRGMMMDGHDTDTGFGDDSNMYSSRGNSSDFRQNGIREEQDADNMDDYEMQFGTSGGGYPTANSGKNQQQRRPETRGGRGRPKTGSRGGGGTNSDDADDFFADDEIPDDFLPA